MVVFKVVWEDPNSGEFYSVCAEGQLAVHYKLGFEAHTPQIAKEKGYLLTVFEDITRAAEYAKGVLGSEVLLCCSELIEYNSSREAIQTHTDSRRRTNKIVVTEDDILHFGWRGVGENQVSWPFGTLFTESLIPLRVVQNWRGWWS